jgi:hypothetical protein
MYISQNVLDRCGEVMTMLAVTKLIGRCMIAVGVMALAISAAAPADAAEFLGPDRLKTELGGHTIKGYYTQSRVNFVEVYLPDSRITYKDDLKADGGRWSIRGTAFCTFYDQINGGCWYVIKRSANCFEFHQAPVTGDDIDREVLGKRQTHALAARDSDKVTCETWFGA